MNRLFNGFLGLFLLVYLSITGTALAQFINPASPYSVGQNLGIKISPEFPGANTEVTLNLESGVYDLNSSKITWEINGAIRNAGVGEKSVKFTTGNLGSVYVVRVNVEPPGDDPSFYEELSIRPAEVDLVWEANTYTPPFYKGRPLFTRESWITFEAQSQFIGPNGRISAANLIYDWSKNGRNLGNASGYGKNTLRFSGSRFENEEVIGVAVRSSNNMYQSQETIRIKPIAPEVILYEQSPLFGTLYQNALESAFNLGRIREVSFKAVPYFFDASIPSALSFEWLLNNEPINGGTTDTVTLRREEDVAGQAALSLKVTNPNKALEFDEQKLRVLFGQ